MFFIPLRRGAYFGSTPGDAPSLVTAPARKRKLDRAFDTQKKFYISLLELRSLDETGLTEAGARQARIRLNDLVREATALLDDMDGVVRSAYEQAAEGQRPAAATAPRPRTTPLEAMAKAGR